MRASGRPNHDPAALVIVGAFCALAGFGAGTLASDRKQMIVVASEEARFSPLDPARPSGPELAVLWGDPASGPSATLLKFKRGEGRLHVHTSDYHLVLLQGTAKHWADGENATQAKALGPGSYWFQPGNQAHADACLTDECLMYVQWADKRDARLAEALTGAATVERK